MFGSFQIARVFGIPIRVHVTLLIILPWLAGQLAPGDTKADFFWGLVGAVSLFTSVVLHELGHSFAALKLGHKVRDITLWPIGGVAMLATMPTRPRDEFIIAIAGPLVSLFLGITGIVGGIFLTAAGFDDPGYIIVFALGGMNMVLFLFNLVPAFPMDGGRILRAALSARMGRLDATRIASKIGRTLAFVYGIYSAFNGMWISVIVAIFIYNAAGQEYRMVLLQEMRKWNPVFDLWGRPVPPPAEPPEISVGPPPYRR